MKVKNYICVIALFTGFLSLGLALPIFCMGVDGTSFEELPLELRAQMLETFLKEGNYAAFGKASLSKPLKEAIDHNPVLKGTLQGLQQLGNVKKLISGPTYLVEPLMEARIRRAEDINKSTLSEQDQMKVLNNLTGFLIMQIYQSVQESKPPGTNNIMGAIRVVGSKASNENLQQLDALFNYILSRSNYIKDAKYDMLDSMLEVLAKNRKIPTDYIIEKIKNIATEAIPRLAISNVLLALSERPDLGKETIQYFKEHENDPNWFNYRQLVQALEMVKQNPAYSQ